jgi:hypothetical protein
MPSRSSRNVICSIVFIDIVEYSKKSVAEQMHIKEQFNKLLAEAWPARAFYTNVIESVTVRRPFNKGLWIVHRWLSCWGF